MMGMVIQAGYDTTKRTSIGGKTVTKKAPPSIKSSLHDDSPTK